jgi:hypothetical protein
MEANKKICIRCKNEKEINNFLSEAGHTLKQCKRCREIRLIQAHKHQCSHGKQKQKCKFCGGSSICKHGKQKQKCKFCGGSAICQHRKQKYQCRNCCKDVIKLTIRKMINNSKTKDIKYNKYDANNFIDKCFLEMLMDESMNCHYCNIEMQLIEYNDTLCTIERKDNSIGHIKSNCVLACRKCNLSKVGNK